MAHNESEQVSKFLKLLDEPFGIITYGLIEDIVANDILEVPKEKEEIVPKLRMSVLPTAMKESRLTNTAADRIDNAFRGTFSKLLV